MKWNIIIGSLVLGLCLSTQSYGFELLDRMLGLKGCGCETKSCETKADTKCGAAKEKAKCGAAKEDAKCGAEKKSRTSLLQHLRCDSKCGAEKEKAKCGAEKEKAKCGAEKEKAKCGAAKEDAKCGAEKKSRTSLLHHLRCDSKSDADKEAGKPNSSKNTAEAKGKPVRAAHTNKCGAAKDKAADKKNDCSAKKESCRGSLLEHILSLGHGCDSKAKACDSKKKEDAKCGAEKKKRCGCDAAGDKAESSAEVAPATPPAPVVDPSAMIRSQRRVVHASLNTVR